MEINIEIKATIPVRVCHVWCNLLPGYTCQTRNRHFRPGTLKDSSLKNNCLALSNCFSYRNVFQNGINALSKSSKFCVVVDHTVLFKFHLPCATNFKEMHWRDFQCQH